jgi:hypothetical protein
VNDQLHALATLSPGKEPWYPSDTRLARYKCTFWRCPIFVHSKLMYMWDSKLIDIHILKMCLKALVVP